MQEEVDDLIGMLVWVGKHLKDIGEKVPRPVLKFYIYLAGYVKKGKFKENKFDNESLYHEMVHYCQYQRKPWQSKMFLEQTKQELDYRFRREKEAYLVTAKIMGIPISEKEAEKRAWASIHGRGY